MNTIRQIHSFRISISSSTFVMAIAIYFGFILNIPVTHKFIEVASQEGGGLFAYSGPILLSAAFMIIFSFLNIPYLRKPLFIFIILSSAIANYATWKYGAMFDYNMIENVFETHSSEVFSYVNLNAILYILVLGGIPTLLISVIKFKKEHNIANRVIPKLGVVILGFITIYIIYATSYKNYASVGRNNSYLSKMINPAHIINSVKYIKNNYFSELLDYKYLGEDAVPVIAINGKPSLIILVVGETARSMNINYNGYHRNTNPHTKGKGVISFQNVSSCGTSTAHSLPCMFSNMSREDYNKQRANSQDNALDIISRTGTAVTWFENDGGDKAIATRLRNIVPKKEDNLKFCSEGVCTDEVMIDMFKKHIDLSGSDNQLVAFHIIGSHGPTYWKRYPKTHERFKPSCNRNDIENCTDQEIINVYDNTITYTDYLLAESIELLSQYKKKYNVALMYISDHGESLGEHGLYLHGTPYSFAPKQQTQVPWILWMDKDFENAYNIDSRCLRKNARTNVYSQDNFFHSLIEFSGVHTTAIKRDMSIFSECKLLTYNG